MAIKAALKDPHGVLDNWDSTSVDPCSWAMVTCSAESLVIGLYVSLAKTIFFCVIGIQRLNFFFLYYAEVTQPKSVSTLSPSIGNLTNLQIILLQNNNITGPIPKEIGRLSKLQTLDLSDNFFTGDIPLSLGHLNNLKYMRLNNNSLSGAIPVSLANMSQLTLVDLSFNNLSGPVPRFPAKKFKGQARLLWNATAAYVNDIEQFRNFAFREAKNPESLVFGSTLGCISLLVLGIGLFLWSRHRHRQQAFFDVKDRHHEEVSLGNLRRFQFKDLQITITTSAAKTFLREKVVWLFGFCMTPSEKLLVYPYMSNGSVASRLRAKPVLDTGNKEADCTRSLSRTDSHVTTAVRGTVGCLAPEYLSTGQSSEKTDVFGFGILLLELITGMRAIEFGKAANQKGAMLDWVRKIHQEKKLDVLVDRDLRINYDRVELEGNGSSCSALHTISSRPQTKNV
ncbi:histidine kinase osmosensor [Datura stramonium]|uniref:Histidine kinase osmosensor n=1 Tax=Datura stramonium TaxID=4076 RepID=A0ABS8TJ66_DATST|nr:histidine kinase osmosensor [Datura stramonium]